MVVRSIDLSRPIDSSKPTDLRIFLLEPLTSWCLSLEFANLALVNLNKSASAGISKEIKKNFFKEFAITWGASSIRELSEHDLLL